MFFTCIWYFIRTNISAPAAPKCPKWPHQTALFPRCAPIYNTLWAIHAKYCKNYKIFSFLKLAGLNVLYGINAQPNMAQKHPILYLLFFLQFRQDYRGKSQNLRMPSIIYFIQYFWKIWLENISQDFLFGGICPRASFLYNISEKDLPSGSIWQVGMTSPTWLDKRQHVQIFSFKKIFWFVFSNLFGTYENINKAARWCDVWITIS